MGTSDESAAGLAFQRAGKLTSENPIRPQNFKNGDTGVAGGDGETGENKTQKLLAVEGEGDDVTEEGMEEKPEELETVKTSAVPRQSAVDNARIPKSLASPMPR